MISIFLYNTVNQLSMRFVHIKGAITYEINTINDEFIMAKLELNK